MSQQTTTQQQTNEIRQRSEMWHRLRLGKFTSSKWHLFTVKSKVQGEPSAGVKSYILELLWQLQCGHHEGLETWQMRFGNEWEPFAKKEIEKRYNSEYFDDEFIQHPVFPYYGGSADGFIMIGNIATTPEIKCPTGKEQLINYRLLKDVETCKNGWPEIYGQVQSNMYLQETTQALAVSFQHEGGHLMYKDLIIPRDELYISDVLTKMAEAWDWMQKEATELGIDILAKYKELATPTLSADTETQDISNLAR